MISIYYLEKNNIPFYVGKTKDSLEIRITNHKKVYGIDIKIILLDEVSPDKKIWKFWECFYISEFKKLGYLLLNKNNGGGGLPFHTLETKEKIRKALLGRIVTKETRNKRSQSMKNGGANKIRIALKGKPKPQRFNPRKGKPNSNLSKILTGREHIKIRKSILQFDLQNNFIKEWSSGKEAGIYLNISPGTICSNLKNKYKSAGGFVWKYKY